MKNLPGYPVNRVEGDSNQKVPLIVIPAKAGIQGN